MQDLLTCVVCYEVRENAFHCRNSHTHCVECIESMSVTMKSLHCSVCRSRRGWSQNTALAVLAKKTRFMVKCGIEDCSLELPFAEVEAHRRSCPRRMFTCPVCEICDLRQPELAAHVSQHRPFVKQIARHECVNIFTSSIMFPGAFVLVFEGNVICVDIRLRDTGMNETRLELSPRVLANMSPDTNIRMITQMYNLCNTDLLKASTELSRVASSKANVNPIVLPCFDNCSEITIHESIVAIEDQWSRDKFISVCADMPFHSDNDSEYEHIFAIVLQFERFEQGCSRG